MAKLQVLYKDLTKRLTDLITKEFPSEKQENKIEWVGTTPNGVVLESNLVQKKDGSITGTFLPTYKFREWGGETSIVGEFNTRKEFKVEFGLADQFTSGLKTTLSANSKGDDVFGVANVEFRNENLALTANVDYGKAAGSTLKGSGVFGSSYGAFIGGSIEYFVGLAQESISDLKEMTTTVGYATSDFDLAVFGRLKSLDDEDKHEVGASYFHKVRPDTSVGSEIVCDIGNADVSKPKLVFVSQYSSTPETTLKAKIDTDGKLSLSYGQQYNKGTKFVLAGTFDTNNLGSKSSSAFGFTLSLKGF